MFIQGGSIVPTRERPRRSSPLMKQDPFTLRIALDQSNSAKGRLYLDDGETYAHEKGEMVWRELTAKPVGKNFEIQNKDLVHSSLDKAADGVTLSKYDPSNSFARSIASVKVEKIVLLGLNSKPTSIKTRDGKALEWEWADGVMAKASKEGVSSILTVKNPGVHIASDWSILIE